MLRDAARRQQEPRPAGTGNLLASEAAVCVLSALSDALCFDAGGKLAERHRPPGSTRGVCS